MENEDFIHFLSQMIPYLGHFSDMVNIKNEQSNRKADPQSFVVCTTVNELISRIDDLIQALNPDGYVCPFCDPDKFVVYGKCGKCGREVNPPLESFGDIPIGFCTEKGSEMLRRISKRYQDAQLQDKGSGGS